MLRAQLLAELKRKALGRDKFHTFSCVSGQRKELVNQTCGAGDILRHTGSGPRTSEAQPRGSVSVKDQPRDKEPDEDMIEKEKNIFFLIPFRS